MPKKPKSGTLGFACFVLQEDGTAAPIEALEPEEREAWRQRSAARLGEAMSDYYTQHPEEFARI